MTKRDAVTLTLLESGRLEVNTVTGQIFSNTKRFGKRLLSTRVKHNGYVIISLIWQGKRHQLHAHRIILFAIHGDKFCGFECDHINRVRHDNRPCNLRVATPAMNQSNRDRNDWTGTKNGRAKLNPDKIREFWRMRNAGLGITHICETLGIRSNGTYSAIVSGKTWGHVQLDQTAL